MKYLSLVAISSQLTTFSPAAIPPPPPESAVNISPREFILTGDLVYNDNTYFVTMGTSNVLLSFEGTNGTEALTFDNPDNTTEYIHMSGDQNYEVLFKNLGEVNIEGNYNMYQAIRIDGHQGSRLAFHNIAGDVNISGPIWLSSPTGNISSTVNASVEFDGIGGSVIVDSAKAVLAEGGIIHLGNGLAASDGITNFSVSFTNIDKSVIFSNNEHTPYNRMSACIAIANFYNQNADGVQNKVLFQNIGEGVKFIDNSMPYGPLFLHNTVQGDSSLVFNQIGSGGDGIALEIADNTSEVANIMITSYGGDSTFSVTDILGDVVFARNSAEIYGGVITLASVENSSARAILEISNVQGDVIFADNKTTGWSGNDYVNTTGWGGAIQTMGNSGEISMLLSADGGDIIFTGNTHRNGLPNAIALFNYSEAETYNKEDNDIRLRAREGRSVRFYDPIHFVSIDDMVGGVGLEDVSFAKGVLNINEEAGYTGTVLFSGKGIGGDLTQEHYTSKISGDIILHNGTLAIEEGAVLGTTKRTETFIAKGGTLDITSTNADTPSTLAAETIAFDGSVLRIGENSRFEAKDIDMSKGLTVDLAYYLPGSIAASRTIILPHEGLQINADTMALGGNMQVADKNEFYYTKQFWAEDTSFVLFDTSEMSEGNINGKFDDIISEATGSSIVADPYQYQGEWSLEWLDDKLIANWTATGEIEEIRPEMDGSSILNTLWSTASNVASMSRAGLDQLGTYRFRYGKDRNLWINGLGDFASHGRSGTRDGYDYRGGGYAVGMDEKIGKKFITGLSIGHLMGYNQSRNYMAKTDQNTIMGMLYGGFYHSFNEKNSLDIKASAAYGNTENKSRAVYQNGTSYGKWDNHAWMLTLYGTWTHELGHGWSLTPYMGLEYTDAQLDSFTETGFAARRFSKDNLKNLALPVGTGIQKAASFNNGLLWITELKASYVPDVYRKNPATTAEWLDAGFSWMAQGVSPVRNAGRVELNTRLQVSTCWTLFGGYTMEGRRSSTYHQFNLGANYSF